MSFAPIWTLRILPREQFTVLGYRWFALRTADSTSADLFHRFGVLRSDYEQKLAFAQFQKFLQEL